MCGRAAASQAFICVACIFMPAAAGCADLLATHNTGRRGGKLACVSTA
jgi:hypothetical protein